MEDFQNHKCFDLADRVLLVRGRDLITCKSDYFIYVLKDPRDDSIRYVGQTSNLKRRFEKHLYDKQGNSFVKSKSLWVFELKGIGLRPKMDVVETLCSPVDRGMINERENRWIFHFYQQGANLTNVHCIRMPRLYKAVRNLKIDFLTEPLDSAIWTELLELQKIDQKEWAEINRRLWAEK